MSPRLLLLLAAAAPSHGITLPTHFASSMVLQRGASTTLWGLDTPSATISATLFGAALPPATADAAGRFSIPLPALPANATPGALVLRTSSGAPALTLADVVVGDVFVCSGQS
jgi:sialate O-acetylesterase